MAAPLDQIFAPAPDAIFRDLGDESVVLDLATGTYFGLNATGTRMWQLIDGHRTLGRVVSALEREFDAPPAQLERDLLTLVTRLEEKGLLCRTQRA